jgi:glycosyltransferase involved in cell wall biosynthesis
MVSPAVRVPKELRTLRHPVIGYAGYRVRDRLDLNLIDELAASRPNWSFVFIGPHVGEEPLREITARRPNVVALGPVDYSRLPSYVAAFDVCILPNRINAHTAGNDPIKLYDYLAAGKPIVSTQTSGADKLGDMVTIADSGPPFLEALERAMETDSIALRDERVRTAAAHSWK